jgi:hypothetical protein
LILVMMRPLLALIGYAYPASDPDSVKPDANDLDGDGLINGFEDVIGTDPGNADTDGDGQPDGDEYPLADVPVSDPDTIDLVFANGFD